MKIHLFILIACMWHSSLGQSNTTINCSSRGSCHGGRRNRLDMNMDWSKVNCMCDTACIEYGDCCPTAQSYDPQIMKTAINNYDCVTVFYTSSYYMKSSCASDWSNPTLEALCRQAQDGSMEDPLISTPASSISSGVTYRNYYCAICNKEQHTDLHSWEVMISCPLEEENSSYVKENLVFHNGSWGIWKDMNKQQVFQACEVYPKPKDTIQHLTRECKDYVSTCASNWTDTETQESCSNHTLLVYGPLEIRDSTIGEGYWGSSRYRNYHCAQCNFIEDDELACYERDFRQAHFPTPVSFSVLFDFGSKETICANGYLWDSFFRKCRLVRCIEDNYEFQSGRCVRISEGLDTVSNNSSESEQMTCERVFFDKSEYTEGINGSIIIVPYRRTYQESEYEITDDGVFVCRENGFSNLMGWLTLVGIGLSCVCLVLHIVAFSLVSDLRNLSGKNLICLCLSLLLGYISFLVVTFEGSDKTDCKILAYTMYYGFMASFSWMNVMAYDVWRTLRLATSQLRLSSGQQWRKFIMYSLYGWLLPLLMMGCVAFIDNYPSNISISFQPEMGDRFCWFGQPNAILVYFVFPLVVIMTMNFVFFTRAVRFIQLTAKSTTQISSHRPQQTQLKLYSRLALLMGLSWIFGIAAGYAQIEYLWYIFILVNAFQGVFILMAFTCTDKVYKELDAIWKKNTRSLNESVKRQALDSQDSNTSQMNTSTSRLSSYTSPLKQ